MAEKARRYGVRTLLVWSAPLQSWAAPEKWTRYPTWTDFTVTDDQGKTWRVRTVRPDRGEVAEELTPSRCSSQTGRTRWRPVTIVPVLKRLGVVSSQPPCSACSVGYRWKVRPEG